MINLGTFSLGELGDMVKREEPAPPGEGPRRRRSTTGSERAVAVLIEEAAAVSRRLQAVLEKLHGGDAPPRGRRALLRDLARLGPQTVPQLARRGSVTRQHVQALVNGLAEAGYVELLANPVHRRSKLVGLTERGGELITELEIRERELYSALEVAEPVAELRRAADILRSVRGSLEGPWS
jgi:DNA-binding MarR family transcriptional regulator